MLNAVVTLPDPRAPAPNGFGIVTAGEANVRAAMAQPAPFCIMQFFQQLPLLHEDPVFLGGMNTRPVGSM